MHKVRLTTGISLLLLVFGSSAYPQFSREGLRALRDLTKGKRARRAAKELPQEGGEPTPSVLFLSPDALRSPAPVVWPKVSDPKPVRATTYSTGLVDYCPYRYVVPGPITIISTPSGKRTVTRHHRILCLPRGTFWGPWHFGGRGHRCRGR